MSKHTPGPWEACEPDNWHGICALVRTKDAEPIAQLPIAGWPRGVGKANADLVAAAPELLAALRGFVGMYPQVDCVIEHDQCVAHNLAGGPQVCRVGRARAAIAKAEGKTC